MRLYTVLDAIIDRVKIATQSELTGGTETAPRVVPPSVFKGAINSIINGLGLSGTTITTPTITQSSSDVGTLGEAVIARYGKVRSLRLTVSKSTATSAGSNVYSGALANSDDCPAVLVNAAGYFGSSGALLQIAPSGGITVRIIGAQLAANSNVFVGTTYIVS